jgi:hypothetical protein
MEVKNLSVEKIIKCCRDVHWPKNQASTSTGVALASTASILAS